MTEVFTPTEDGHWVSENFARLAELIQQYDCYLVLQWIPPESRAVEDNTQPFRVFDTRTQSTVMHASELESPHQILARLFQADHIRNGNILSKLEAHNAAVEAFNKKKFAEELEDARDQAKFLFKSPLNYIRFNGKKLDDQRREIQ